MYYIGVNSVANRHEVFVALMHRKTAKRVYEPSFFKVYENLQPEELKIMLKNCYLSEEYMILKKKFSQSGRPPKKVVTRPYFVISDNVEVESILNELRASYCKVLFKQEDAQKGQLCCDSKGIATSISEISDEGRIDFKNYKDDTSDFNRSDALEKGERAFGLIAFFNEKGTKRVKRY